MTGKSIEPGVVPGMRTPLPELLISSMAELSGDHHLKQENKNELYKS